MTIDGAEQAIAHALQSLPEQVTSPNLDLALRFLAPPGFRPIVEIEDQGQHQRRDAPARSWNPETGELRIYFVRQQDSAPASSPAHNEPSSVGDSSHFMQQLGSALEEVEREGRAFIALKWFRDEVLPNRGFTWAVNADERQAVLTRAIEAGLVLTGRITNPRSPYPTTTIRLNRSKADLSKSASRYAPRTIPGVSLSDTILRDRGPR